MKERTIWSSDIDYDDWKADYQDWLADEGYTEDDAPMDLYEWVSETNYTYLRDERSNLNVDVDGVIVCFANLGLWDGKHEGASVFRSKINEILYSECDYVRWYCDQYNVRCKAIHHDGTNHYLYRVAKDEETAKKLAYKFVYEGMTEEEVRKRTKSLRPYVAKVYGWK